MMNLDMQKYIAIRQAQHKGARTIDELKKVADFEIENDEELKNVEIVLKNACRCKNVSIEDVLNAVNSGFTTLDEVMNETGAGTGCGICKGLVESIITNKR